MQTKRRASGKEFATLMQQHGLRNLAGAELVADLLYVKPQTIMGFYTKGILRTELRLLEILLKSKRE